MPLPAGSRRLVVDQLIAVCQHPILAGDATQPAGSSLKERGPSLRWELLLGALDVATGASRNGPGQGSGRPARSSDVVQCGVRIPCEYR
jgi:hypothetical protein